MYAINQTIEKNHRSIIISLSTVIVFMATSCLFNDLIPICHEIFGCDHKVHVAMPHLAPH
jgi:hypothetical protein